jgi:hypothetical protein
MHRRDFVRLLGSTTILAWTTDRLGVVRRVAAELATPTLDGRSIPKFVTPLLVPPAMPRSGRLVVRGLQNIDYYEIAVRQFTQQILPAGFPATRVWGYGPNPDSVQGGPVVFNAPSLTIEAKYNRPVRIKWMNQLVNADGTFLRHLLPVDPSLHWANPGGGVTARDTRPSFDTTPGSYTGPVPLVTHVHGAVGVGDESDGYAEAWFLPPATNIPAGYATEGTCYQFFKQKAFGKFGERWSAGSRSLNTRTRIVPRRSGITTTRSA